MVYLCRKVVSSSEPPWLSWS